MRICVIGVGPICTHATQLRIACAGNNDAVALAERCDSLGEINVRGGWGNLGEQDNEAGVVQALIDRVDHQLPVKGKQGRLDARKGLRGLANQSSCTLLRKIFVNLTVDDKHMHLIARAIGKNSQKEGSFDLSV